MLPLLACLLLVIPTVAGTCVASQVSLTSSGWSMPPTSMLPNTFCPISFTVPSGTYATITVNATKVTPFDHVFFNNTFNDASDEDKTYCDTSDCDVMNLVLNWPGNFTATYKTSYTTTMILQMTVTLTNFNPSANIVQTITTTENGPSSVIYFQDFKKGQAYKIQSSTGNAHIDVAIADSDNPRTTEGYAELNSIFVYDGNQNVGTFQHIYSNVHGLSSNSNNFLMYAATDLKHKAAVFITDKSNIDGHHFVDYLSSTNGKPDGFVELMGDKWSGAATTMICEKGGSQYTLRKVNNAYPGYGNFSYMAGGPTASHANAVSLSNKNHQLPLTVGGVMNTFYITEGQGSIKFTIN